jgi:hypothetical protein
VKTKEKMCVSKERRGKTRHLESNQDVQGEPHTRRGECTAQAGNVEGTFRNRNQVQTKNLKPKCVIHGD